MLIEFTVGNFKSFRDPVTFSMVAANLTAKDKRLDVENLTEVDGGLRLLRSAAIYGANASGKTNLAAALAYMRRFVLNSSRESQADEPTGVEAFLLSEQTEGAPSFFEIVFLLDGKRFRYGFELTGERVISEWLFFVPTTKEARLFIRDLDSFELGDRFSKEGKDLDTRTRKNALFLSVVAQFNGPTAQRVVSWFRNLRLITGLEDFGGRAYTLKCLESKRNSADIVELVKRLDLGIHDIDIETVQMREDHLPTGMPDEVKRLILDTTDRAHRITTLHRKYDDQGRDSGLAMFNLDHHESEGTRKLFALAGPLIDTLKAGRTLFIDEFDARLHPLISRELVRLFNATTTNPHNAQLIFTTHDTNLLSNKLFRRDQIWFVEKDRQGCSRLYSLAEYKVRNDASFESDYIQGRYGAIPFLGDIARLVEEPGVS